jgi:hypothetical protein
MPHPSAGFDLLLEKYQHYRTTVEQDETVCRISDEDPCVGCPRKDTNDRSCMNVNVNPCFSC